MGTTAEFVKQHKITLTAKKADSNPHMSDQTWEANHYRVTLRRRDHQVRRQYTLFFSMGTGHTKGPEAIDVLECLASDAAGFENAADFRDWLSEYGYEFPRSVYNDIAIEARRLKQFLGDDLYNELVWNSEY